MVGERFKNIRPVERQEMFKEALKNQPKVMGRLFRHFGVKDGDVLSTKVRDGILKKLWDLQKYAEAAKDGRCFERTRPSKW